MLVIFLLLFASMTMAFPMDGTDESYHDWAFVDDFTTFATGAWDSVLDMPTTTDQLGIQSNLDGAVPSPGTLQGMYHYPSPASANNQAYIYPEGMADMSTVGQYDLTQAMSNLLQHQYAGGRQPDLCPLNVMQLDQAVPRTDVVVQDWVNGAYALGDRNQTSPVQQVLFHWQPNQQTAQVNAPQTTLPTPLPVVTQSPHPPTGQPSTSTASVGYLRCDHPNCDYTCTRRCDMTHHRRCHLPPHRRPHVCVVCSRRFLFPRELRRHMAAHGVGARHLCPHSLCRYASRGFGRSDHLMRHLRNCHAASSRTVADSIPEV